MKEDKRLLEIIIQVQDYLSPKLTSYEQMLYHYLFRHTYLEGKKEIIIGVRTIRKAAGLGIGKAGSHPSEKQIVRVLNSLESKKCIETISKDRYGRKIKVNLPMEIPGIVARDKVGKEILIDEIDFFTDIENRLSILKRENYKCFYCMKMISKESFTLDHIIPTEKNGNNTYKNVVAACFECNSRKQNREVVDFVRLLYREDLLSYEEYKKCLSRISEVKSGKLKPIF